MKQTEMLLSFVIIFFHSKGETGHTVISFLNAYNHLDVIHAVLGPFDTTNIRYVADFLALEAVNQVSSEGLFALNFSEK